MQVMAPRVLIYPSQTNTTGIFTNLPVADYLITVRNLDTNCEIKGVHYVNEPNTFDLTIDTGRCYLLWRN
jgi:hypothetical protein